MCYHHHCTAAAAAAAAARTAQDKRRAGEAFVYTVEFKTAGPMGISFNLANVSRTLFYSVFACYVHVLVTLVFSYSILP
jgi:hypothetical protein